MEDRMMTLQEVGRVMGATTRTLRRWLAKKCCPIPFFRVGVKVLRARQSDVEHWLRAFPRPDSSARLAKAATLGQKNEVKNGL